MGSGIRKTNASNDKKPATPSDVTTSARAEEDDNRSNQQQSMNEGDANISAMDQRK
jgi:hypothetical protein